MYDYLKKKKKKKKEGKKNNHTKMPLCMIQYQKAESPQEHHRANHQLAEAQNDITKSPSQPTLLIHTIIEARKFGY